MNYLSTILDYLPTIRTIGRLFALSVATIYRLSSDYSPTICRRTIRRLFADYSPTICRLFADYSPTIRRLFADYSPTIRRLFADYSSFTNCRRQGFGMFRHSVGSCEAGNYCHFRILKTSSSVCVGFI